jgi:hypothetical protein
MDEEQERRSSSVSGDDEKAPPTPRWVKLLALVVVGLLVLLVAFALIGGEHGPGRHQPAGTTVTTTS